MYMTISQYTPVSSQSRMARMVVAVFCRHMILNIGTFFF